MSSEREKGKQNGNLLLTIRSLVFCLMLHTAFFLMATSTATSSSVFIQGNFQMEQNPSQGLCTPGSTPDATQPLPTPSEGDLYHMVAPSCDVHKGFSVETYNGVKACILISTQTKTYFEASTECQGMGGFLMSAKTDDKLWILYNKNANDQIWVGCDDLVKEGTYVWQEDGESFTDATKPPVFHPGDPNNYNNEDCIFRFDNFYLADLDCFQPLKYACEMPIV